MLLEHAHQSGVGFGADGLDAGIGQSPAVRTGTQGQVRGAFHGAVLKEPLHFSPGSGFGAAGEGYFRLSAFNSRENVMEAMGRIQGALKG